jgi:hypothetical protein
MWLSGVGLVLVAISHLDRDFIRTIWPAATALAYLVVLSVSVWWLRLAFARDWIGRDSVMLVCAALALAVPGFVLSGTTRAMFVVLGFEFVFSAYSYVVEVAASRRKGEPESLREAIFFLVVNPVLVYPHRGKQTSLPGWRGASRFAGGVGALAGYVVMMLVVRPALKLYEMNWFVLAWGALLSIYAVHSGVASLQIGAMRMIGYDVPERYRYPLLAASPIEWWRRWNTYVGSWFQSYVFFPSAVQLGRRMPRWAAKSSAVVLTFVASGAIHMAAQYATARDVGWEIGAAFLAYGVLIPVWRGIEIVIERKLGRSLEQRTLVATIGAWVIFSTLNLGLLAGIAEGQGALRP